MRPIQRRRFLILAGGTVIAVTGAGSAVYVARKPGPTLRPKTGTGTLSSTEMETVQALAEVVVPSGYEPPRDFLVRYINSLTRTIPGYRDAFERGVAYLKRQARLAYGTSFERLPLHEREAVLEDMLVPYAHTDKLRRKFARVVSSPEGNDLEAFVLTHVAAAIYKSPVGWSVLGYANYMGAPANDPLEYTRAPVRADS